MTQPSQSVRVVEPSAARDPPGPIESCGVSLIDLLVWCGLAGAVLALSAIVLMLS